ncbi:Exosome complex component rrp4 [Diaporthe australafricana]|uniref:Exosome complex component rrp4 n=1 Tax=Diaporthe australafricana TaxID=127596 RepID=A0ABR3XRN9_9PEZI
MPITIIQPKPVPQYTRRTSSGGSDSDSDDGGVDIEGDIKMATARSAASHSDIVTPGEVITTNPQWMRGHGTYTSAQQQGGGGDADDDDSTAIVSSLAGVISRTNKLLSVRPLRARYTPEVGDLVVGRIVEVQSKRWRVDVGSVQLAGLPLSAINLPGGIQRRRTETDELAIRFFFAEGDLLVAEVQQLYADGGAVLHTRSLRYGKLRNGVFLTVSGVGGGGGVVRSRRQVWTMEVGALQSKIDVVLGVNGYVWISKHVEDQSLAAGGGSAGGVGVTNMEESVSQAVYSSQNDYIEVEVMREITRVRGVITALVENGLRVDEDMIIRGYHEAVEIARLGESGEEDVYLGGERGQQLAATLVRR